MNRKQIHEMLVRAFIPQTNSKDMTSFTTSFFRFLVRINACSVKVKLVDRKKGFI
jgi:hypothetical protein